MEIIIKPGACCFAASTNYGLIMREDIEVIIPAYNEEKTISSVVRGVKAVLGNECRVTVINDASTDRTAVLAGESGARVINHPYRIGNGACVKTGLRAACAKRLLLMDADGQHLPADIPLLLAKSAEYDMVVGQRLFQGLSPRNFANKIYNALACYTTSFAVKDLTSGFRLMNREIAARFIYLLPNSFSYPTTLTLAFLKTGRTLCYVPVESGGRSHGKSKVKPLSDGLRFFLILVRISTFFSPLKVFLPVSLLFFFSGFAYYLYTFKAFHRFTNMSLLLFNTSVIVFMLGLVSEQVSSLRMEHTEES